MMQRPRQTKNGRYAGISATPPLRLTVVPAAHSGNFCRLQ
jgi:hypothetical protein